MMSSSKQTPPPPCLVMLTGLPCSRKSEVVGEIQRRLLDAGEKCKLVDEPSLSLKRNVAYRDARMEKIARQTLLSTVERNLRSNGPHVILDSMNLVKGFRYQLWCIARENACRCVTVFCADSREVVTSRNLESSSYRADIFDDLCERFEYPDSKDRWHKPMFTLITTTEDSAASIAAGTNANSRHSENLDIFRSVAKSFREGEKMFETIVQTIQGGESREKNDGSKENSIDEEDVTNLDEALSRNASLGDVSRKSLRPTFATKTVHLSDTNLRYTIDKAVQSLIESIAKQNAEDNPTGSMILKTTYAFLDIPGMTLKPIHCSRRPTLVELRRYKRDFLKISSNFSKISSAQEISQLFAECVKTNVG